MIDRIGGGMMNDPSPSVLSSVADAAMREILQSLLGLEVGTLRNNVLHHRAYRPLRAEVERCLGDEVLLLYRAKRAFKVGTFVEFRAGVL